MVASAYCASGLPACGGALEQSGGAPEILRHVAALQIQQAEIVGGEHVAELGRLLEQLDRLRHGRRGRRVLAMLNIARLNIAFGSPCCGAELVPFGGFRIVQTDAEALRIEFAEQASSPPASFCCARFVASLKAVR